MTQEDAFLRAIRAEPEDDAPRLVFADWLEESGDPRGEFIRVQCALAKLPLGDPRRPRFEARERELLGEHDARWVAPVCSLPGVPAPGVTFRRGFVERATIAARTLLERGDDLFQRAPMLTEVRVTEAAGLAGALAQSPHLGRLTALHLGGTWITPGEAAGLVGSPHLAGLAVLQLPNCALGDEGLRALVRSPAFPRLADWVLTDNGLSDDGLAALAGCPHFPRLASLHLGHDAVGAMRYDSITRGGLLGLAGSRFLTALAAIHWYELTEKHEAAGTTEEVLRPPGQGAAGGPLRPRGAVRLVTHVDTIW